MTVNMDDDDMTPADRNEVALKRETQKAKDQRYATSLAAILSTKEGRCVLYRVLENCGMFRDYLGATSESTNALAGRHVVAVALWSELTTQSVANVADMIRENSQ